MSGRKFVLSLAVLLAFSLLVPGAQAGKLYAGASLTQSTVDLGLSDIDDGSLTSGNVDDSDTGWKAFVGFRFVKFLAIEADFIDVGGVSIAATSDGSGPDFLAGSVGATAKVDGYRVSALGIIPIGQRFSILARYGVFYWDATATISNGGMTAVAPDDDSDDFFGAGVAWQLKSSASLRLEYELMTVDDTDIDTVSAGVAFRF